MKGGTLLLLGGLALLATRKSPSSPATPPPFYTGGVDALPTTTQADRILNAPNAATALQIAAQSNLRIVNNPEVAAANRAAGFDENGFPVTTPSGGPNLAAAAVQTVMSAPGYTQQVVSQTSYGNTAGNPYRNISSFPTTVNGIYLASPNDAERMAIAYENAQRGYAQ